MGEIVQDKKSEKSRILHKFVCSYFLLNFASNCSQFNNLDSRNLGKEEFIRIYIFLKIIFKLFPIFKDQDSRNQPLHLVVKIEEALLM